MSPDNAEPTPADLLAGFPEFMAKWYLGGLTEVQINNMQVAMSAAWAESARREQAIRQRIRAQLETENNDLLAELAAAREALREIGVIADNFDAAMARFPTVHPDDFQKGYRLAAGEVAVIAGRALATGAEPMTDAQVLEREG